MKKLIISLVLSISVIMFYPSSVFADVPGIDTSHCENDTQDYFEDGVDCGGPCPCGGCEPDSSATVYYISTSGSYGNNGTSISTPWNYAKLDDSWDDIDPGDYVLFKRGDTFAPSGLSGYRGVLGGPDGTVIRGTEGNPITIGAYGLGDKPIISRENSAGLTSNAFHCRYISYVTIQDIEFKGGLAFGSKDSEGEHHVRLLRLTLTGGSAPEGNNEISFYVQRYESDVTPEEWTADPMHSNEIAFCTIKNPTRSGMQFYGTGNNWVHHNEIYNTGGSGINFAEGAGNIIEYNIVSGTYANSLKHSSHAFRADSVTVRYNLFLKPGQDCMALYQFMNSKVYNNTCWAQGGEPTVRMGYGGLSPVPLSDVGQNGFDENDIYNNIFCGNTSTDGIISFSVPKGVNTTYRDSTEINYYTDDIWEDNYFDNNTIYNSSSNKLIRFYDLVPPSAIWPVANYLYANSLTSEDSTITDSTFSTWTAYSNVTGDLNADPLFEDAYWTSAEVFGDFSLESGSSSAGRGAYAGAGSANTAPTVSITAPDNGDSLTSCTNVTITATASDDDSVVCVEFFEDSVSIGVDSLPPYSIVHQFEDLGGCQIKATATDTDQAATSDSISVTIVNTAPTISITAPDNGDSLTVDTNVTITATASDNDSVVCVEFFEDSVSIGVDSLPPYSIVHQFEDLGGCQIKATATDNDQAAMSDSISVTIVTPGEWTSADIGSPGVSGSTSISGDTITMQASGADIWSSNDSFRYFYDEKTGDCEVSVKVDSLANTSDWAKAGIMFRESLDSNSKNVLLAFTPLRITLQKRLLTDDEESTSKADTLSFAPRWLKLVREGSIFSAYYSENGTSWTYHDSTTVSLSSTCYLGLAVTSHNDTALTTAGFSDFSENLGDSNTPPTISITAPDNGDSLTVDTNVTITAIASDDDSVVCVEFFEDSVSIGVDSLPPYSIVHQFEDLGGCQIKATATDNDQAAMSDSISVTIVTPGEWTSADIGSPGVSGSTSISGDTITMQASGADIWSSNDSFRYFYDEKTGDCEVSVKVDSLANTSDWAKAGIMFRESLDSNSKNVLLAFTPLRITLQKRLLTDDEESTSKADTLSFAPRWLKLVREGSIFSAYYSENGTSWTYHDSTTVSLSSTCYLGLAVTSHNDTALTTAGFSDFSESISGANNPPEVSITEPDEGDSLTTYTNVTITASASDDDSVSYVEFFEDNVSIGVDSLPPYSIIHQFEDMGICQIKATATDTGQATTSDSISVTIVSSVFQGWTSADIGSPGVGGSTDISDGTVTIEASGTDIWSTSDHFRYFYDEMSGDGDVIVHVDSLDAVVDWSKAGIMFRESLAAGSKNVYLAVTGHKVTLQDRPTTDGDTSSDTEPDIIAPRWLKLNRNGNVFTAYYSDNDTSWTTHASATVSLSTTCYLGLAVTSHVDTVLTTAVFSDFSENLGTSKPVLEYQPQEFMVSQNFPNPFNPTTNIRYELPKPGKVVIIIHNVVGQQVRRYDMGYQVQGVYDKVFDASGLTSGLYFYTVDTGYSSATGKMMLMK